MTTTNENASKRANDSHAKLAKVSTGNQLGGTHFGQSVGDAKLGEDSKGTRRGGRRGNN